PAGPRTKAVSRLPGAVSGHTESGRATYPRREGFQTGARGSRLRGAVMRRPAGTSSAAASSSRAHHRLHRTLGGGAIRTGHFRRTPRLSVYAQATSKSISFVISWECIWVIVES